MRHTTTTAAAVLASLALLAGGCAGKHKRAQADVQEQGAVESDHPSRLSSFGSAEIVAPVIASDEAMRHGRAELGFAFPGYDRPASSLDWDQVARELVAMRDPAIAGYRRAAPRDQRDELVHEYVRAIDAAHVARLKEIVHAKGWPAPELVGARAASAAVLTVQYAGHDPAFMGEAIEHLMPLVEQGKIHGGYVAVLSDRLAVYEGRHQLYGTQMKVAPDAYGAPIILPATPIEDPAHLDARRTAMGLPRHEAFKAQIAAKFSELYASVPTE